MYCPQCGNQQAASNTRFCSRCGFLLTGVEKLLNAGGAMPEFLATQQQNKGMSARKRGLKNGALLFFSGMILVPLLGILTEIFNGEGYVAGAVAIVTFLGGILRMIYALIFESGDPAQMTLEEEIAFKSRNLRKPKHEPKSLPARESIPADYQAPSWREEPEPNSVTEETTNLLKTDEL